MDVGGLSARQVAEPTDIHKEALMTLADTLTEWNDFDGAAFELGIALGVLAADASFKENKWIFWSNNPVGKGLHATLVALVEAGVLETNEEGQFRWAYVPIDKTQW
jgi:hypothetical protein